MRPEIIAVFLWRLWKAGMVWGSKMVECGCGWPVVRTMMMIVMLKMRVPMLSDFCMMFHVLFGCFWNVTPNTLFAWKTQGLRESWLKSYVFYRGDIKQQANGSRGSDAYPSQVRSLSTKVEGEKVVRNSKSIDFINLCIVKQMVCENQWSNHMCFTVWTSENKQTAAEGRRWQASSPQPVDKSTTASGQPRRLQQKGPRWQPVVLSRRDERKR